MATIAEAISEGASRLREARVSEDRLTAGLLLGHRLGSSRAYLLTRSNEKVEEAAYNDYLRLIERRAAGEPLQYITGHQEFYGLDFTVTQAVLIPRPETEFLVERVIDLARNRAEESAPQAESRRGPVIVDAGTGSGCIAITLAAHIKNARVLAIDISGAALEVARKNAERHAVANRIEFIEGDLLEPLTDRGLDQAVDFIASNPPYVDEQHTEFMQREVREWEPRGALFGGANGLEFYGRLLDNAPKYLKPGGHLILEIGYGQLEDIRAMIDASSLELIDVTNDLQGIPRTLVVKSEK